MNDARAYALQLTAKAQGEAAAFDKVYTEYKLAPEVTRLCGKTVASGDEVPIG